MMLDWNDIRYFIAVAREGSTLAAARQLRTSQTTVARRVAALEEALKLTVFDKRQAGYALTADGEKLVDLAGEVGTAIGRFQEAALAQTRSLAGHVRVTSDEIFATTLLAPILRDLHEAHPQIVIELDNSSEIRDLGGGEADIALRSTSTEQQPDGVVGRRIGTDDWTFYCSREYAERKGAPNSLDDLKGHAIVGGGGGNIWRQYRAYLEKLGLADEIAVHQGSSTGLLSAVRSGFGIGVLPCIVGDAAADLIRCLEPRRGHGRSLWLFTHERVRHSPSVRTTADFLYEALLRHVRQLDAQHEQPGAIRP